MATTIAVNESTLQMLTKIKKDIRANSLDETIVKVMQKVESIPNSMFGSQPKLKKFTEIEKLNSHEL